MKSLGTGVVTWSYQQYRSNAEKEYDNFWKAFFRELVQNSNDAGSTYIRIVINPDLNVISCADNGCGMDLNTIQNKLLVIGGSQKGAGAVGGLGKAKELLYFSHPFWEVHTLDHAIKGEGGEYEIFENNTHINGTVVKTTHPEDSNLGEAYDAAHFIAKNSHIRPDIYINDKLIGPTRARGPVVRDLDAIGRLHYKKTERQQKIESYHVDVSVNGCWMFSRWIGSYQGHAILDIDSERLSPVDGLTANRDNLKSIYGRKLDTLIREIVVDRTSAFKKKESTRTVLEGNGTISVYPTDIEIDDMCKVFEDPSNVKEEEVEEIAETLFTPDQQLAIERIQMTFKTTHRDNPDWSDKEIIERYAHIMNYEPDFVLLEDPDRDCWSHSRIKLFLPTQKAATIAKVWTETIKQVLLDNGITTRFVAGFTFAKDNEACYEHNGSHDVFYVNPTKVPPTGIQNKVQFMNWMRTTAIHEVTHKFIEYHDESFMSKYHSLDSNTWDSHRIYARIGKLR